MLFRSSRAPRPVGTGHVTFPNPRSAGDLGKLIFVPGIKPIVPIAAVGVCGAHDPVVVLVVHLELEWEAHFPPPLVPQRGLQASMPCNLSLLLAALAIPISIEEFNLGGFTDLGGSADLLSGGHHGGIMESLGSTPKLVRGSDSVTQGTQ